ncbi:PTS sugar transporter subunit IIA [Neobacillus dielmonensis]|uniref:PTS sugar transporter subunit IIA n=1 Tax=Neobacillus dielmonensis TaxID=1347369 RepID=UPI0005A73C61|nr:PTS glucose transporter subunit IIA [Neobacillus dielmonensis]
MFKNLFGKKEITETIVSPITGTIVKIEDVPDQVFSEKMIGDGLAIQPSEGVVVAPIDGEVVQIFPTNHAVGIRSKNGLEVLIHIGMDTVAMNGEGFEGHVAQGDKVKAGDKLVTFNLDLVKEKAESTISPVVITNFDMVDSLTKSDDGSVIRGESVLLQAKIK